MKNKRLFSITVAILLGCFSIQAQDDWPRDIPAADGQRVTMYEPQPESLVGNKLTGRAAVSVRKNATEEPIFGAIFFTATLLTDKSSRMAELESLTITNAKFPGVEDQAELDALTSLIQNEAPKWNLNLSIDDLVASIKQDNASAGSDQFNNEAPVILYANKPTTLVVLDGAPQVLNDKNMDADKVVNSPNLIFKEGSQWNLYVGGVWYKSTSVTEGWKQNTKLSKKVKSIDEQVKKQEKENNDGKTLTDTPKVTTIIVATEPTELLQTDGEPDYKTLEGTSLLYVANSPNEIFKDINSQKTYVLIAGRWYNAAGIKGPWTYIPSDKLPEDFAKIPEGSGKDGVLANVAGTDAAEEARMDAEIPQTAKVDRKTATVQVEYDGAPQFNPIEGTSLQLAENANLTVMIDPSGKYFALDNGVWFTGNGPNGPWSVANDRPRDVEDIPANSPAYNSKYVYIYDQTPDYVYTGYTSGYLGSYIYGPTIVYGTGYRYRPWFRTMYYPRPVTWGFGFIYNPWNGWNMNWGYNFGFLYVGFNYGGGYRWGGGGGWFGPPMYRPPYRPAYWSGGYYGRRSGPSYGNRSIGGSVRPAGNINRPGRGWVSNRNIYNDHRGVITRDIRRNNNNIARPSLVGRPNGQNRLPGNRPPANNGRLPNNNQNRADNRLLPNNNNANPGNNNQNRLPANNRPPANSNVNPNNRANNVLTDRDGNIFRRDQQNNSWQSRDNKARDWKPVPNDNNNTRVPDLNRQQYTRDRAETRQDNFSRDMPATRPAPAPRPAPSQRLLPSAERSPSSPVRQQQPVSRPAPVNRSPAPSAAPRQQAPVNRQSAPQSRPSGGGGNGGGAPGSRPQRR